jgi:hypothetical protein
MALIVCECGRSFLDNTGIRLFCNRCRRQLRRDHRCICCGAETKNQECDSCRKRMDEFLGTAGKRQLPPPELLPKYRSPEHREDVRATKGLSDN